MVPYIPYPWDYQPLGRYDKATLDDFRSEWLRKNKKWLDNLRVVCYIVESPSDPPVGSGRWMMNG